MQANWATCTTLAKHAEVPSTPGTHCLDPVGQIVDLLKKVFQVYLANKGVTRAAGKEIVLGHNFGFVCAVT